MIFFNCISELMLATLIQRYDKKKKQQQKKNISFQEQETNRNFTCCKVPHFIIVLIPYINLLKLNWIMKYQFLRTIEPLIIILLSVSLSVTLRKHAYSNILKILPPKNENFQMKISSSFHISAQNIDCGYPLEPPRRGGSNEYPQSMF